jgi:hypothetical protein
MFRTHRAAATTIALAILLVSATQAMADSSVPIKATFSGSATTDGSVSSFAGSGQSSHLGRIMTVGQAVLEGPSTSCAGGIANVNEETLTAPDGSTLTIRSDDVACPIGTYRFHGTGSWVVVGGTGRFAKAAGSGSFDGSADFIAGTFTITLDGLLSKQG